MRYCPFREDGEEGRRWVGMVSWMSRVNVQVEVDKEGCCGSLSEDQVWSIQPKCGG